MPQRILCVSYDKTVSKPRCFALREAGYDVIETTDIEEAMSQLEQVHFDLVILGHRFEKDDKKVLISEAKSRWHVPVLLLCGGSPDADLEADARVFAIEGTEGLLNTVAKLMHGSVAA